jgi:hypothetical protein
MTIRELSDEPEYTVPECGACLHTTPAGSVCGLCQPMPEFKRCKGCHRRGAIVVSGPSSGPSEPPPVAPPIYPGMP